ncbi:hypothetical protein BigBertha_183 [Bacillus phage BigBertha]|uniref:Uncharacterized protein n=1 Tax=Bacillus phage BigBertha TaxID=1406781 RepID=U5PSJ3_9CAUD|nr:hypothetical protein BigBertha_183 [Bacillus phage BigBertha]AGY46691.1 hypothetical protein BigBertha_183 [Bacillus phage BigBertha]
MTKENPTTKIRENERLEQLKELLESETKKVHGISYFNDFFSKNHLVRSHIFKGDAVLEDNELRIGFFMRVDYNSFTELDNTLEWLVMNEAGDIPGYIAEGDVLDKPHLEEKVSEGLSLFTADVVLNIKEPNIVFETVTIGGEEFVIARVWNKMPLGEDDFVEQSVNLLFGDADKFSFLSHLVGKELTIDDGLAVLDLIEEANLLGKAVQGASFTMNGADTWIGSHSEMIQVSRLWSGGYYFRSDASTLQLDKHLLESLDFSVDIEKMSQSHRLVFKNDEVTLAIYLEI